MARTSGKPFKIDPDTWNALASNVSEPMLVSYTISDEDVAGPFDRRTPRNLGEMAELQGLFYKDPVEELAEKFHMSEDLLHKLNPRVRFDRAGEKIVVANVQPMQLRRGQDQTVEAIPPKKHDAEGKRVVTIVVDKAASDVRAYDQGGRLVAFYPATIGSEEKPAPTGTFKVTRVAWNPDYHYDPKFAWKDVKANHKLTVKPGPNNPVGRFPVGYNLLQFIHPRTSELGASLIFSAFGNPFRNNSGKVFLLAPPPSLPRSLRSGAHFGPSGSSRSERGDSVRHHDAAWCPSR
jgi:lipoprotein-anchoring transpeptidase ErfK/SrfK